MPPKCLFIFCTYFDKNHLELLYSESFFPSSLVNKWLGCEFQGKFSQETALLWVYPGFVGVLRMECLLKNGSGYLLHTNQLLWLILRYAIELLSLFFLIYWRTVGILLAKSHQTYKFRCSASILTTILPVGYKTHFWWGKLMKIVPDLVQVGRIWN